jgi:hypothetical protein
MSLWHSEGQHFHPYLDACTEASQSFDPFLAFYNQNVSTHARWDITL